MGSQSASIATRQTHGKGMPVEEERRQATML